MVVRIDGITSPVAVNHLVSRRVSPFWALGWEVHGIARNSQPDKYHPWRVWGFNHHRGEPFSWRLPDVAGKEFNLETVVHGRDFVEEARKPNPLWHR